MMSITTFLLTALLSGAICAATLALLLKTGWAWKLAMDVPNERSLHTRPTPRVGGWGIVLASSGLVALASESWLLIPFLTLAAISFLDDRLNLPSSVRFLVHMLCATFLLWHVDLSLSWWMLPPLVLACTWMTNLYNFMDGADGLAGGMALIGFGAYGIAAMSSGGLGLWPVALAGAAGGFLLFNFHPAKIFMGDAGSIPLGFMAAALGVLGYAQNLWAAWFPVMVFSPFIADASITLAKRLLRGEKFWQAHREHYYQRLIRMGCSHKKTALYEYGFMLLASFLALMISNASALCTIAVLVIWFTAIFLVALRIDARWKAFSLLHPPKNN